MGHLYRVHGSAGEGRQLSVLDQWAPAWRPGLLALLVLAPLFFISYGAANHWAASQAHVDSIVFDWESHIPLLPWTILPYWSIDLFYGLSLLLADSTFVLRRQVGRLLTAQLLCVSCFYLWPLRFSTPRPPLDGWEGALFDALTGFDLPFNQAPSLHIVLLLILWDFYRRRVSGRLLWFVHTWSALIGISVLTTYQHHAIDIPTGMMAGALCMWLWPLEGATPWQGWRQEGVRYDLAVSYALGAAVLAVAAVQLGFHWSPLAWGLWWPAAALMLVASAYVGFGRGVFQKQPSGRQALAAHMLLAPHRWLAWFNARCWTWRMPSSVEVCDGVWLGRLPLPWERDHFHFEQVLDVTAELGSAHAGLVSVPMLDLLVPSPVRLREVAQRLDACANFGKGPLLVCCALGFSRSAAAVLTWLCVSGKTQSLNDAVALLRQKRPQIVLSAALLGAVEAAIRLEPGLLHGSCPVESGLTEARA